MTIRCDCGGVKGIRETDGTWRLNPANRYSHRGKPVCCMSMLAKLSMERGGGGG